MKKILFICGSHNQTTQMHRIADRLPQYRHAFSPYYADGLIDQLRKWKILEAAILGNRQVKRCLNYLHAHDLPVDYQGKANDYDLVVTCSDLVMPKNIRNKRVVLVQEGMTDPENIFYTFVKRFPALQPWLPNTATTGQSDCYEKFCVASNGYRDLFIRKGIKPEKLLVTGIPNFDDCRSYLNNTFPHRGYVLVCTSDLRETMKYENRKAWIRQAVKIAAGRQLIFKLHPNENTGRATAEVHRIAPHALVYSTGSAEEMIANCDVLLTRYSSVVYIGMALGKEVYSDFDLDELRRLMPLQHRQAAENIAGVCRLLLDGAEMASPIRSGKMAV